MYLAELDGGKLSSKNEFMRAMDDVFGFPRYFSGNWGSLAELMRDPFWINDNEVILRITNSDQFSGKIRLEALNFLNDVKEHLEKSNTKHTLKIELV